MRSNCTLSKSFYSIYVNFEYLFFLRKLLFSVFSHFYTYICFHIFLNTEECPWTSLRVLFYLIKIHSMDFSTFRDEFVSQQILVNTISPCRGHLTFGMYEVKTQKFISKFVQFSLKLMYIMYFRIPNFSYEV